MKSKLFLLIALIAFVQISKVHAQEANPKSGYIISSQKSISKALRDLPDIDQQPLNNDYEESEEETEYEGERQEQLYKFFPKDGYQYANDTTSIQRKATAVNSAETHEAWIGQTGNLTPNDPTGAVGPNHYVQMVNATSIRVYSKTGTTLQTKQLGNLWSPATGNAGDPVVMYDKNADRWFLAQFGGGAANKIYIAISTSPDPTGTYFTYTFNTPSFTDYPKFGIWHNGYYMTCNMVPNANPQIVYAFDRAAMLTGTFNARAVYSYYSPPRPSGLYCGLPGDAADTDLPPSNIPCPIFSYEDNGWGAGYFDRVNIYQMSVDWVPTIPTSSISLVANINTSAFDASPSNCPQPNTAKQVDGNAGFLMFRASWRNLSTGRSVLLNWSVKISATQRAIKWCELRRSNSTNTWSLYQEGIYAPDNSTRWMGSIAMDQNGSIGIAYTKTNATNINPGIYYTGRRVCDPLGTFPVTELVAFLGTGSKTSNSRIGDYSQLTLDPADGVTFWYTGEYIGGSGSTDTNGINRTGIFSFQISPCNHPDITISSTQPTVCKGTNIQFSSVIANGGASPIYQWLLNGQPLASANASTFSSTTLPSGAVIKCVLTSSLTGSVNVRDTSNGITITINENNSVTSTIVNPSTICKGQTVNLIANTSYCIPTYSAGTSNGIYISKIRLDGNSDSISNYSGASGYPYYTFYNSGANVTTTVTPGNSYFIRVEANPPTTNNAHVAFWIDYNHNNTFEATEKLGQTYFQSFLTYAGINFVPPANTVFQTTRLRIRLVNENVDIQPCDSYIDGETEDYNISINGVFGTFPPSTYTWSSGTTPSVGSSVSAIPSYSQTYTVTATNPQGCTSIALPQPVTVNSMNIVANASSPAICSGQSSTLIASVGSNYCSSFFYGSGTSTGNYIASHQIIDLTNTYNIVMDYTSGASSAPYYTLFPASGSTTTTLIAGNTYSISFNTGPSTNNKITAFIDYDKNKLLDEGFEKIGQITINGSLSGYFYFIVPNNAKNGTTRLRLRLSGDGYYLSSCATGGSGETEDYDITITGGVNNVPPIYTWSPATSPTSGSSVTASPTASTNYIVTATDADGCTATASAPVMVTIPNSLTAIASPASICAGESSTLSVSADTLSYCQPQYTSGTSGGDFISSVYMFNTSLSNFSGASLNPYYTLYPQSGSSTATLTAGNGYYLTINVGSFASFNNVAAWIDYNGDGTWFGPLEKLGESGDINTAYGSASLLFFVPTWAKNGTCRLRIREAYSTHDLDPCATYTFGETEDYNITITGGVNPVATTYAWSPITSPTTGSMVSASPISATTYTVTATGNYGCTKTTTALVNMNTTAQFYSNATSVCLGTPIDFNASANACSGNAFYGNGSSYAATLLSSYATTALNNITMEAWVKWNGASGSNQFIYYNGNSNLNGYGIIVNAGNANKLTVYLGGVAALNSTVTLSPNVWQHVAVTKGGPLGGTWRLFVDGTQYTLTSSNTVALTPGTGGTYVGRSNNLSEYFNGAIDEVRIWSTAISSFLIPNERVACITAPQTNLVGYWKFNEAIGGTTLCTDASGGNRTLTLSNSNARTVTANYAWNYGDATIGNGITTLHTYPSSGSNYTTTLTVTDITGCAASSIQSTYVNPCILNLNLTLYIQGFYQGSGMMTPVLANAGIGSSFIDVDSVTVELHDVMPPFATAYTTSGMLQVYGNLNCPIPFAATGNSFYVVIKHRNSLETWSKFPVSIGLNTSFNFTSQ